MTYRNDGVDRGSCIICGKPIVGDEKIVDLFRSGPERVVWVHDACVVQALETWVRKKRERDGEVV